MIKLIINAYYIKLFWISQGSIILRILIYVLICQDKIYVNWMHFTQKIPNSILDIKSVHSFEKR